MTDLEPLYTLRVAVELIPYPGGVDALREWLTRRPDRYPPRYQRHGHRWHRMLLLSELRQIRAEVVKVIPTGTHTRHPYAARPEGTRSDQRSEDVG